MSKKLNLPFALGVFLIGLSLLPSVAKAQVVNGRTNAYWDVNGTTTGEGGLGSTTSTTWSASSVYWTTNAVNAQTGTGPTGGGLFAVTSGAPNTAVITNSGGYYFNFTGNPGIVGLGASMIVSGLNFTTDNYTLTTTNSVGVTLTGTNAIFSGVTNQANISLANNVNLNLASQNTYALTLSSINLVGGTGSSLTLGTGEAGVTQSVLGGTVTFDTTPIRVNIGTGSKFLFGSQSSGGMTVNGNITNSSASGVALNITNSSSGIVALNGVISGANGLVLDNTSSGKIVLAGANTYAAGTTVNGTGTGSINLVTSNALGTGTVTISAGSTAYLRAGANALDFTNAVNIGTGATLQLSTSNNGHKTTWSGVISGTGGGINYNFSDAGLYLTGTNSSFGGGVNVSSSGTLFVNKLGMAGANSSIGTNGTITISPSGTTGAGKVRWTGSADETSDKNFALTTVSSNASAGMQIFADGAAGATLTLDGNINSTGINNKIITLGASNNNTLVLNGTINQTSGYTNSLVVGNSGFGTVVLNNANNSFGGGLTINAGSGSTNTVQVSRVGNAGANSSIGTNGTINIGGSSSTGVNILKYVGTGETNDKVINLAGTTGGATLDQSGTGNLKFSSATTATGVGAKTITLQGSTAGTGEIAGAITNAGGNVISLSKSGSGKWTLSGANTYDGATAVNAGVLNIQNGSALGSATGGTAVAAGAELQLQGGITVNSEALGLSGSNGATASLRNISGNNTYNGTITFTSGTNRIDSDAGTLLLSSFATGNALTSSKSLVVGGSGDTTFSGRIVGSSTSSITKEGTGTLTLANTNFDIGGGILVNNGKLNLATNNALGATRAVVINGGTLDITTYDNTMGAVTVTNGGRITGSTGILTGSSYASGAIGATNAISANLAGTGGLALSGNTNTTVLSGSNTYSGDTELANSTSTNVTLRVNSTAALSTNTSLIGASASARTPTLDLAAGDYVVQAYKGGNLNIMATNGNASLTFTNVAANATANDMTGGSKEIYATNVNIAFAGGMDITGTQNKTATYSGNRDFTFNGGITNANTTFTNNVEFVTTGMVNLNASNNYNGLTTFSSAGGTLVLGNNNALGTTNIGTIIANGAALDLNGKEISDEGLTIQGAGVSSGGAIKNSSANAATWSGAVTMTTNTTVNVANGAVTISGAVGEANTSTLTKAGTGLLTLSGANTYSGGTVVSAGTLSGDTTSLLRTITNNATVTFNQSTNGTYSGVMSGTGLLSKTNSGSLTLSGANSYTGATMVNQGTLLVATNGSIASSSLATVNGGLLQVNGTAGGVTVNRGGGLGGTGTVGAVTLKDGSFLKPGNSPGLLTASLATWEAGSTYNWEIDNADGTAGRNWDLFSVTGALDLSALSSSAKMNLVLESLSTVTNFSATNPDSWVFAQAGSLVGTAFTAGADVTDLFNINATAFNDGVGPANGWRVEVGTSGSLTTLNLMAVPEPSTGSMFGLGLAGLVATRLLRRKNS